MDIKKIRPTIADVARHAGVSTATVSRVINRSATVEGKTAERVVASIDLLKYKPHAAARTLASRRTDTIGLLLPEITGPFFLPMLRGVETAANEAGYDLLVHTTRNPETGRSPRRTLAEHNTDGLLVFTNSLDARELTRLYENDFPVVLLHQTPPKRTLIPTVTVENKSGTCEIVSHLIEIHQRTRIVFLQGPRGHEDSDWREWGYKEALSRHDIPYDPTLVFRGGFNRQDAQMAVEKFLQQNVKIDGIFSGDDEASVGVLLALRHAGILVPSDVSVVGFDDQIFSATLVPPLTTVRAPTEQVGIEAIRQLVHILSGETVESRLVLSTELIIRESCGCSPVISPGGELENISRLSIDPSVSTHGGEK